MDRPEHVGFILGIAHQAKDNTEYQISFRAWQLRELMQYIHHLEQQNRKEQ
jgi:hypothetical protein